MPEAHFLPIISFFNLVREKSWKCPGILMLKNTGYPCMKHYDIYMILIFHSSIISDLGSMGAGKTSKVLKFETGKVLEFYTDFYSKIISQ